MTIGYTSVLIGCLEYAESGSETIYYALAGIALFMVMTAAIGAIIFCNQAPQRSSESTTNLSDASSSRTGESQAEEMVPNNEPQDYLEETRIRPERVGLPRTPLDQVRMNTRNGLWYLINPRKSHVRVRDENNPAFDNRGPLFPSPFDANNRISVDFPEALS